VANAIPVLFDGRNMYYVYEWYRSDLNLPYYIGKGKGKRAYDLKRGNDHTNTITAYLIKNGIRRDVRIIANFKTEDAALAYEEERISFWWYLKDFKILTNQTKGGKAPPVHVGENNPAKRPEIREILSAQKIGIKNPNYGKTPSSETNAKRGASVSSKRQSETEEQKRQRNERIWATRRANGTDKIGTCANRREIVVCGKTFKSQKEFADYIGMSAAYVTKCLKSGRYNVLESKYKEKLISNDNQVRQCY
jgi:hypothetical protein